MNEQLLKQLERNQRQVKNIIGTHSGTLHISYYEGKFYWGLDDYNKEYVRWTEISRELYSMIINRDYQQEY